MHQIIIFIQTVISYTRSLPLIGKPLFHILYTIWIIIELIIGFTLVFGYLYIYKPIKWIIWHLVYIPFGIETIATVDKHDDLPGWQEYSCIRAHYSFKDRQGRMIRGQQKYSEDWAVRKPVFGNYKMGKTNPVVYISFFPHMYRIKFDPDDEFSLT